MTNKTPYGKLCKVIFAEKEVSPKVFAHFCGVGYSYLNDMMTGNKSLSIKMLHNLILFSPPHTERIIAECAGMLTAAKIDLSIYDGRHRVRVLKFLLDIV